jgi:molecular chaperone GrpE (heat shock protein)
MALRVTSPMMQHRFLSATAPPADEATKDTPPATPLNPLEELQAHLTAKDKEIKELKSQHLLDLAEMENVRMRSRRDIENERSFALTGT